MRNWWCHWTSYIINIEFLEGLKGPIIRYIVIEHVVICNIYITNFKVCKFWGCPEPSILTTTSLMFTRPLGYVSNVLHTWPQRTFDQEVKMIVTIHWTGLLDWNIFLFGHLLSWARLCLLDMLQTKNTHIQKFVISY